jgi:nitrogen fixation NifU-like protein
MTTYSEILMDHFQFPRNSGKLEAPDCIGRIGSPGNPPFMILHFHLLDERVEQIRFQTFGCGPAIAAGSRLTEMVVGRTISECMALTETDLSTALGGVPPDKKWCVELALAAMRNGLSNVSAVCGDPIREGGDSL